MAEIDPLTGVDTQVKFDAGFAYIFADSPSFNQNQGSTASNALVNGTLGRMTIAVADAFSLDLSGTGMVLQNPNTPKVARGAPGSIVCVASIDGIRSAAGHASYGAAKEIGRAHV